MVSVLSSILLARCRRLCDAGDVCCCRPASRAVGRLASRPCLLDASAVYLDASPRHLIASSHRSCLAACRSPLRASSRSSTPLLPVIDVNAAAVPWFLASPPRFIDTLGGAIRRGCGGSLGSACLLPRLAISSVRFGIGWRRGSVLAPLDCPLCLPPPRVRHLCRLLPALVQSDFLAVLPSFRPIISSPSLPDHSTRGTGRNPFARVLCIAAAGVALLAWVSYYVSCRWVMW